MAKTFILILIATSVVSSFLPYIIGVPEIMINEILKNTILSNLRSTLTAFFWYLYFCKSRRVKETYNLS